MKRILIYKFLCLRQETRGIFHLNKTFGNAGKLYRYFLEKCPENLKKFLIFKLGTIQTKQFLEYREENLMQQNFPKKHLSVLVRLISYRTFRKCCSILYTANFHKCKPESTQLRSAGLQMEGYSLGLNPDTILTVPFSTKKGEKIEAPGNVNHREPERRLL